MERIYSRKKEITIGADGRNISIPGAAAELVVGNQQIKVYACHQKEEQASNLWNGEELSAGKIYQIEEEGILQMGPCEILFEEETVLIRAEDGSYHTDLMEIQKENFEFEGFPNYKRSPRIIKRVPKEKIEIQNPPERFGMGKTSLIQMIVPPVAMTVVTIVIGVIMKMGAAMMLSGLTTLLTTVFTVIRYFNERKECKEKNEKREILYQNYLLDKRKELNRAKNQEVEAWFYNYPHIEEIEKLTREYSSRIYERNSNDDDFLTLSVGYLNDKVSFPIEFESGGMQYEKDSLQLEGEALKQSFETIEEKPYIIDLKKAHLGLVGDKENVHEQLKLMITQLAFAHSYHDLQIITIYNKSYDEQFAWMKWLPHCKIQSLNLRGIINSEHMRDQVLGSILQILKDRKMKWEEKKNEAVFSPYYLFVIDEPKLISSHAIMEYLDKEGERMAFSIIYTTQQMANLPDNIGTVVELLDSQKGKIVLNQKQYENKYMNLYHVGEVNLEWIARDLSVLHHEQGIVSQIPENITFYEMYQVQSAEELKAEER